MAKTRKLWHVHCKSTNEDWYYLGFVLMKKDAYKFPISIPHMKRKFAETDYFEAKGFYFRKSILIFPTSNKTHSGHFKPK